MTVKRGNLRLSGCVRLVHLTVLVVAVILLSGCAAGAVQVIPTVRPTATPTITLTPTYTPDPDATPTLAPTRTIAPGSTPTPLFGPTRTPSVNDATPTRSLNPNTPRIEFFTSDRSSVAPGDPVTLFWSTRNATRAVIYQLNRMGERERLWNVGPDGTQQISTRARDRGRVDFMLLVGEGELEEERQLSIDLECPVTWFFEPSPAECPNEAATETLIVQQAFERGRMIYVAETNQVYALFNDGFEPAWISRENRYDPAIHPEREEAFVPPPGFYQPTGRLGFVWRSDAVRNRLGLGLDPELPFNGFIQSITQADGTEVLYVSSTDAIVLQILPRGSGWQIITLP